MNSNKCLSLSPYSIQNLLCSYDTNTTLAPIVKPTRSHKSSTVPFIELPKPNNCINDQSYIVKKEIQPLYTPNKKIYQPTPYHPEEHWGSRHAWNYSYNHSDDDYMKIRRKRATVKQTQTLQKVFERTAFPSTILRENLARHLGMSPRTVQIWFQNKRQAVRKIFK
ncbi:hypothetical protein HPULCUR_012184 [Helicostylum pulchrum]|uniref:Homeobox domain-containing protein n=1 Tax=Helicostylum pulchrum TaxID=562976 RepID=A0ABP9YIG5_9FUNG